MRRLPRPVYAISHDGRQALSLNFARLHHQRPGYGYAGLPDPWLDLPEPEDDGIYQMDLESGESRLILSVAQAARLREAIANYRLLRRLLRTWETETIKLIEAETEEH